MARKKSDVIELSDGPVDFSKTSRASELIKKSFGPVIYNGQSVLDTPREVISISPALDSGLHGGFVTGSLITLAGDAGCGKTTTALVAAARWQERNRRVYYLSAESRFYSSNLQVAGLDASKIEVISSVSGSIMTAEKYLEAAEIIIKNERNALIIIDSLSILSASSEMEMPNFDKSPPVGGSARLVGSWCRRMQPIIPINDNMVIGIAHVYANIGGKKKWAVSLAQKALFARSTGLVCDWVEPQQNDGDRSAWGQKVHWTVERTPLGAPKAKVTSIIRYAHGIDREYETIEQGKDLGLVDLNGAMYKMSYEGEDCPNIRGMEKACAYLRENPESYARLTEKIRYMSFEEE